VNQHGLVDSGGGQKGIRHTIQAQGLANRVRSPRSSGPSMALALHLRRRCAKTGSPVREP